MKTIFMVEDEKDLADTLALALRSHGYAASLCYRLEGAFAQAKQLKPAVVLVDVMLPDGAGYALARHIRMDSELYKTPVLFMSCLGEGPEIEYALNQGGDGYLTKPFVLRSLLEKLADMEALRERIEHVSTLTGLHSLEALEREMSFRILHHIDFTACLVSIVHFREYVAAYGEERGRKILEWTAQLFRRIVRDLHLYDVHVARIKGEHFLATVPPENAQSFREELLFEFKLKLPDFYSGLEIRNGHRVGSQSPNGPIPYPVMELDVERLSTEENSFPSASAMIHHLELIHGGKRQVETKQSP